MKLATLGTFLGAVAAASIAAADTVALGGFLIDVPADFVRGADELRIETSQRDALMGGLRLATRVGARDEVRALRRRRDDRHDELLLLRSIDQPAAPPVGPAFVDELAARVVAELGPGATLVASKARTLRGGVGAAEVRVRAKNENASFRLYALAVPRDSRLGSVEYLAAGLAEAESDAAWEAVVGSMSTTLAAPALPAPAETSAAFRAGGWLGLACLVAVGGWLVARARRRPARGARRDRGLHDRRATSGARARGPARRAR